MKEWRNLWIIFFYLHLQPFFKTSPLSFSVQKHGRRGVEGGEGPPITTSAQERQSALLRPSWLRGRAEIMLWEFWTSLWHLTFPCKRILGLQRRRFPRVMHAPCTLESWVKHATPILQKLWNHPHFSWRYSFVWEWVNRNLKFQCAFLKDHLRESTFCFSTSTQLYPAIANIFYEYDENTFLFFGKVLICPEQYPFTPWYFTSIYSWLSPPTWSLFFNCQKKPFLLLFILYHTIVLL